MVQVVILISKNLQKECGNPKKRKPVMQVVILVGLQGVLPTTVTSTLWQVKQSIIQILKVIY